jgi:hypothetical protein
MGICLLMTDLLVPSDRLVTDRGERVEAQPKAPRRSRMARLLIAWPYIVPLLVLSVVYGRTVQRSTGNHFSVDTTKFDYLGLVLGTAHPPGYPLYTMLNAAFVRIVPWGVRGVAGQPAFGGLRYLGLPRRGGDLH